MQEEQARLMKDSPQGTSVKWFHIDENTHGSVLTFPSKETYDNHKADVDEHLAKTPAETGYELMHVHEGVVRAESAH